MQYMSVAGKIISPGRVHVFSIVQPGLCLTRCISPIFLLSNPLDQGACLPSTFSTHAPLHLPALQLLTLRMHTLHLPSLHMHCACTHYICLHYNSLHFVCLHLYTCSFTLYKPSAYLSESSSAPFVQGGAGLTSDIISTHTFGSMLGPKRPCQCVNTWVTLFQNTEEKFLQNYILFISLSLLKS